jgi:hypothetical protein
MTDLTKTSPRSVRDKMLGIVQLARTTDKAKAAANGNIGEYHYDCPMDKGLFDYLGIQSSAFLNAVKGAKNDSDIEAFVKPFIAKKDPRSIEAFNKKWLSEVPTGESLKSFNDLRTKVAPTRTDVTTWPDLLDLDEGRTVPQREAVHS